MTIADYAIQYFHAIDHVGRALVDPVQAVQLMRAIASSGIEEMTKIEDNACRP